METEQTENELFPGGALEEISRLRQEVIAANSKLVTARSVATNYGRHFEHCGYWQKKKDADCDCKLSHWLLMIS